MCHMIHTHYSLHKSHDTHISYIFMSCDTKLQTALLKSELIIVCMPGGSVGLDDVVSDHIRGDIGSIHPRGKNSDTVAQPGDDPRLIERQPEFHLASDKKLERTVIFQLDISISPDSSTTCID